jgi:enoyl-CoA hydratase/carnithine racemase
VVLRGIVHSYLRLARIAGKVNANRYIFTSEFIPAKRAYELGIVSEIFPTADLHTKVIDLAKEMTNRPITALIAAK